MKNEMLICLIIFVLGYLISRMFIGNGLMVGGQKKKWKCEYNGKLPKDICFNYYYGSCIKYIDDKYSNFLRGAFSDDKLYAAIDAANMRVDINNCKSIAKKKCIHSEISSSDAKIFAKEEQIGCSKSSNTHDGKCKGSRKTSSRHDGRIVGNIPYNPYCMNVKVKH